ncbi:hypothetical protein BcabD6B2_59030 (apicoplast) [Babesia caballi]|uniref:Ribosomal protein S8 n=1 Tax=Babesia caballi TaxID=5871 RepID=A0AAV4M1X7_BABCB|nr:hypothetical protein BcabD6B2_59030 [Babesia caballi]
MNTNKYFFKNTINNIIENKIQNKLFFNIKKKKVRFYNYSNIYYKKLYKTLKLFSSILCKCKNRKFNIIQIKTILFNKQSKEYVTVIKHININNILNFFYK